jgi:hypothetical protein
MTKKALLALFHHPAKDQQCRLTGQTAKNVR